MINYFFFLQKHNYIAKEENIKNQKIEVSYSVSYFTFLRSNRGNWRLKVTYIVES
jgi:hypothetical protein